MVRLTPSAPAGHSAALAVPIPIKDVSKNDAAMVLRMPALTPVLDNPEIRPGPNGESSVNEFTETVGGGNLMTP